MTFDTKPARPAIAASDPVTIHEIADFVDAESMRIIRNQVRRFMTHNTKYITRQQQMEWYHRTYKPARQDGQMYGFVLQRDSEPVGYGMIQKKDNVYWVGGGLTAAVRGQGIGVELFSYLTRYTHALDQPEVWLDVREDNPAQHLYEKLGYMVAGRQDGLIIMKHVSPEQAVRNV